MNKITRQYARMVPRILLGALIDTAGVGLLMVPSGSISGGVMGTALILNKLVGLPAGVMTIVMNIPLFVIAWRSVGLRFLIGSILGMAGCSVFLDLSALLQVLPLSDPMLAAIFGGALSGLGQGIIYSAGGSTGGLDIVAKILRRRFPYINFGTFGLCLNCVVFAGYALTLGAYEEALYSVAASFVISKVLDTVVYGFNFAKVCYIVSDKSEVLSQAITTQLERGATILNGKGAYTGAPKGVILCAIRRQQFLELKKIVQSLDPNAFVIISDTREILGHGFEYLQASDD